MGVRETRLAALSIASVLALVLTGCSQDVAPPPDIDTPSTEPSTPPTVEPTAEPTDDILFTVTANVRAADGRTIGISMAAHAPKASTDPDAEELRSKLIDVCGAGTGAQPITEEYLRENGSSLMRISIASTAADLTFATPIDLIFGSPYFAQAAIGDGVTPDPEGVKCFNGFAWAKSGSVLGVADFENPSGSPDLTQWKFGRYGFFVKPNSGATIEACKAVITEAGMKTGITDLPGWSPNSAGDGISCKIGYVGE